MILLYIFITPFLILYFVSGGIFVTTAVKTEMKNSKKRYDVPKQQVFKPVVTTQVTNTSTDPKYDLEGNELPMCYYGLYSANAYQLFGEHTDEIRRAWEKTSAKKNGVSTSNIPLDESAVIGEWLRNHQDVVMGIIEAGRSNVRKEFNISLEERMYPVVHKYFCDNKYIELIGYNKEKQSMTVITV